MGERGVEVGRLRDLGVCCLCLVPPNDNDDDDGVFDLLFDFLLDFECFFPFLCLLVSNDAGRDLLTSPLGVRNESRLA